MSRVVCRHRFSSLILLFTLHISNLVSFWMLQTSHMWFRLWTEIWMELCAAIWIYDKMCVRAPSHFLSSTFRKRPPLPDSDACAMPAGCIQIEISRIKSQNKTKNWLCDDCVMPYGVNFESIAKFLVQFIRSFSQPKPDQTKPDQKKTNYILFELIEKLNANKKQIECIYIEVERDFLTVETEHWFFASREYCGVCVHVVFSERLFCTHKHTDRQTNEHKTLMYLQTLTRTRILEKKKKKTQHK